MKKLISVLGLLLVSACGGTIEMTQPFDAKEVSFIKRKGSATLSGQAFFRQRGGGVVTCAGNEVRLIPAGAYTKEFITRGFGSVSGGRIAAIMAPQITHPTAFGQLQRKSICDAEGDFVFSAVANGEYYVSTIILWEVPGQIIPEGGALAKFVKISGGHNQRVIVN